MLNQKNKSLFSIHYNSDGDFSIVLNKIIKDEYINKISAFLYLLTYNSPICKEIIEKIQLLNNINKDKILLSWAKLYLDDKNNPIINPILTFKNNVK